MPSSLTICQDGVPLFSFEPQTIGNCTLRPDASFVEVRGQDSNGEVVLATIIVDGLTVPPEGFEESITHPGGHCVTVRLRRHQSIGRVVSIDMDVVYSQGKPLFQMLRLPTQNIIDKSESPHKTFSPKLTTVLNSELGYYARLGWLACVAIAICAVLVILGGYFGRSEHIAIRQPLTPSNQQTIQSKREIPAGDSNNTGAPTPKDATSAEQQPRMDIARAQWANERRSISEALDVEITRSETSKVEVSNGRQQLHLSVPIYDHHGRPYLSYRFVLSNRSGELWQKNLKPPKTSLSGYAYILDLTILKARPVRNGIFTVKVDGRIQNGWRRIGTVKFSHNR